MTHAIRPIVAACIAASVLVACGGGGSSSDGGTPAASLQLAGTAATGAAIGGAPVTAKCATGSSTAVTRANGSYTIEIAGGSLPCVLQVAPAGGNALHSVIDGSSAGSVNVNITPLTELVVARLTADAPANLFAVFDTAAQDKVSAAALDSAIGAVTTALQGAVDLSGVDPIKDTLVAANGSTAGNALDGKLDVLQAVLAAAQTTLPELAAAIAASGTTAAPVQAILQPAAADCASLRSGSYVTIKPTETDIEWAAKAIRIDAPALTVSYLDGTTPKSVQMTADGGCAYTIADDGETTTKMLVARSGLAVGRDTVTTGVDAGQTYAHVTIPLQSIPLSELAGTWNKVEYFRDPIYGQTAFSPFYGSLVFDASGTITAWTECDASGACGPAAEAVGGTLRVNPDGGYEGGGSADEPPSRAFAFKTADGHLSMFLVYSTGRGMVAMTKQESQPLPAVGTVSSIWDFSIGSNGLASTLVEQSTTITAVDAAAGTLTRLRTGDSRVDTFRNDDPQTGMRSRAANSCTIGGSATTCAGIVSLTLPGTGVWMYVSSAPQNFFGISIAKP